MEHLRLKLVRHTKTMKYTEGELIYLNENSHLCDTLEDKVRNEGEEKVYGHTAIDPAMYILKVTWSPRFKRPMVLLEEVDEFEGVRMHWGATADNTEGCPLCGKRIAPGRLANIGMTDKLVELMKKHGNRGTLEIVQ